MNMRDLIPLAALALAAASAPAPALAQEHRTDAIHFESNSSKMSDIAQAILDEVALAAKQRAYTSVWIDANTDSGKTALALSRRMANEVAAYLKTKGVDPQRIRVTAMGSARPVVVSPQDTMDKVRNRYVRVTINWK